MLFRSTNMYTISCFLHLQNKESEPSDEVLSDGLLLANNSGDKKKIKWCIQITISNNLLRMICCKNIFKTNFS